MNLRVKLHWLWTLSSEENIKYIKVPQDTGCLGIHVQTELTRVSLLTEQRPFELLQ